MKFVAVYLLTNSYVSWISSHTIYFGHMCWHCDLTFLCASMNTTVNAPTNNASGIPK